MIFFGTHRVLASGGGVWYRLCMRIRGRNLCARSRGVLGEDAAARYLESRGFRVLERNWRSRSWELDLVCRQGDTLVFVEVKTRGTGSLGTPADALNRAKMTSLAKAASLYLSEKGLWDVPCRFDLVAVMQSPDGLDVTHYPDAFDLSDLGNAGRAW